MENFQITIRELVRCYQAFEQLSNRHIRAMDLTPAQFDIIATLGNTQGMSCRELSEKTLITKGTLTGVLDRLEARGIINRETINEDRRSFRVYLSAEGEAIFHRTFKQHLEYIQPFFSEFTEQKLSEITCTLAELRSKFQD
ncbi:MarR family winged helix-turn-helix transcriptional regulator [Iodobacter fluviatilis]|uniref:DNA-binding MarR family transcriptional regulator n=1 Tax=Iodobacter fluviatilis TaxID=537 RepID=A0A377Q5B4_9NEIS|nr:MarR family transcriptional regulator [Iodobacter fluviatilis]TCU84483.1 DNA-binding MarR family transcriptional regulator [Iodobacter fluviatilis]STQ89948.1 Staphylococcal accessory regulator Z [Iodobacter fluviatilis]